MVEWGVGRCIKRVETHEEPKLNSCTFDAYVVPATALNGERTPSHHSLPFERPIYPLLPSSCYPNATPPRSLPRTFCLLLPRHKHGWVVTYTPPSLPRAARPPLGRVYHQRTSTDLPHRPRLRQRKGVRVQARPPATGRAAVG